MSNKEKEELRLLREIREQQKCDHNLLEEILRLEKEILHFVKPRPAQGFSISQKGASNMAITGVPLGGTGTFTETPTPAGGQLQAGNIPVWTVDDTLVTLTPSADGTSVTCAVDPSDTGTSFNLTCSGVASDGTAISTAANVPILAAVPPPATGFEIDQTVGKFKSGQKLSIKR